MSHPVNALPSPATGQLVLARLSNKHAYPIVAFILGMLIALSSFAGYRALASPPEALKTIEAGDIEDTDLSAGGPAGERRGEIKGSFKITTVPPGQQNPEAILSRGIGGACLIADLSRFTQLNLPQSCSSNADCSGNFPAGAGWFGYCVKEQPGPAAGKCWIRPGPPKQLCNRSADYTPAKEWADGTHQAPNNPYQLPAPAKMPLNPQDRAPVRWRVVARLNHATANSQDKHVFGTPKLVPYALQVTTP